MKAITVIPNKDLKVLTHVNSLTEGRRMYRAITKSRAGFMITSTIEADSPIMAFRRYEPKALQSLAVITDNYEFTVYARSGKKVWASEAFLSEMTVGDINQSLYNTCLGNQSQYKAVNATSWASKAFVVNE